MAKAPKPKASPADVGDASTDPEATVEEAAPQDQPDQSGAATVEEPAPTAIDITPQHNAVFASQGVMIQLRAGVKITVEPHVLKEIDASGILYAKA